MNEVIHMNYKGICFGLLVKREPYPNIVSTSKPILIDPGIGGLLISHLTSMLSAVGFSA